MNLLQSTYNLFFDQKAFFAEKRSGLVVPLILTVLYAVVSGLFSLLVLSTLDMGVPAELSGLVSVVGVISAIFTVLLSWLVVSAFFFACLKFIGYAECSYSQVLSVCGYVSGILLAGTILTSLVSLIGSPNAVASLIFSGVILLWSVPVWYFGFQSFCAIPEKKLKTAVLVPVVVMVVVSVLSNLGTLGL